jgi:hypothetical protein
MTRLIWRRWEAQFRAVYGNREWTLWKNKCRRYGYGSRDYSFNTDRNDSMFWSSQSKGMEWRSFHALTQPWHELIPMAFKLLDETLVDDENTMIHASPKLAVGTRTNTIYRSMEWKNVSS